MRHFHVSPDHRVRHLVADIAGGLAAVLLGLCIAVGAFAFH